MYNLKLTVGLLRNSFNTIFCNNVGHVRKGIGCLFSRIRTTLCGPPLFSNDFCCSRWLWLVHVLPPNKLSPVHYNLARKYVWRIASVFLLPTVHGWMLVCGIYTSYCCLTSFGNSLHKFLGSSFTRLMKKINYTTKICFNDKKRLHWKVCLIHLMNRAAYYNIKPNNRYVAL